MRKISLALGLYLVNLFLGGFIPLAEEEGSPLILWGICILLPIILFLAMLYAMKQERKKTGTDGMVGHPSDGVEPLVAPGMAAQSPLAAGMGLEMQAKQEMAVEAELAAAHDKLELIEGIGPTIAGVLHAAGIRTFAQLAEATPEQVRDILKEAGVGNLADPGTWGAQAALAAEGKFDELTALQNELKAGRTDE